MIDPTGEMKLTVPMTASAYRGDWASTSALPSHSGTTPAQPLATTETLPDIVTATKPQEFNRTLQPPHFNPPSQAPSASAPMLQGPFPRWQPMQPPPQPPRGGFMPQGTKQPRAAYHVGQPGMHRPIHTTNVFRGRGFQQQYNHRGNELRRWR